MVNENIWQGNRIKHESKNPLLRLVLNKFHSDIYKIISSIPSSKRILEVGCAEGFVAKFLATRLKGSNFDAIDLEPEYISYAKKHNFEHNITFRVMNLFNLEYPENSFDLVICLEVLEHLEDPGEAIEDLLKYSKEYVLISVPNEPFFSIANILRLKYLGSLGNPPVHMQKWNAKQFRDFLESYGEIVKLKTSTFWNIALIKK